MLWWIGSGLIVAWFILYLVLHRRGWVHLLVLSGVSILFVQLMAYRRTRYHKKMSERS